MTVRADSTVLRMLFGAQEATVATSWRGDSMVKGTESASRQGIMCSIVPPSCHSAPTCNMLLDDRSKRTRPLFSLKEHINFKVVQSFITLVVLVMSKISVLPPYLPVISRKSYSYLK